MAKAEPVVFMFRPKSYEVVSPGRLKEWEKAMIERVGIHGEPSTDRPTQTICDCGTWDDCDNHF
jgi:hypothetical protein